MGWAFLFCAEIVCNYQHKAQQQFDFHSSSPYSLHSEHYSANSMPYFFFFLNFPSVEFLY